MGDSPLVLSETSGGVTVVTFNRPAKKNALTREMYRLAYNQILEARRDANTRVLLLRGAEGAFTAGNDLGDFMNEPPTSQDTPVFRFLQALIGSEKPIIAAVAGPAIGIGTTMLLHCDLVYAAESARFRLPFVDLGLCPEGASSFLLPRMMGHQRAAELLLFGEAFSAAEAHTLGIVNRVVADAELDEWTLDRAKALAAKPEAAVRLTKRLLRSSTKDHVNKTLMVEGTEFLERLRSSEAATAFQAFFARSGGSPRST